MQFVSEEKNKICQKIFRITLYFNCVMAVLKFAAGTLGNSGAMVSDAFHTVSDLAVTLLAMACVKIAGKKSDEGHQYGHEKIESLAGFLLSLVLAATACAVGKNGLSALLAGGGEAEMPGLIAFAAAVVSVGAQETLFRIAKRASAKTGSTALLADAWHHRADALASVASLAGIGCAKWFGLWFMDPAASILICAAIIYTAAEIAKDSVNQLIDAAPPKEKLNAIRLCAAQVEGIGGIDEIRCRRHSNRLYVDVEVTIERGATFERAHEICERVHISVEESHPEVIHCMVRPNPGFSEKSAT